MRKYIRETQNTKVFEREKRYTMEALGVLSVIGIIIFMIINLVIYHKIFSVTYFNLGRSCFMEIFFSWIVAMFEVAIIGVIGKAIFGALFKLLGFVGKLLVIVLAIGLVVFIVGKVVQMINQNKDMEEEKQNRQNVDEEKASERVQNPEMNECGTKIEGRKEYYDEFIEVSSGTGNSINTVNETTGNGGVGKRDLDDSSKVLKTTPKELSRKVETESKMQDNINMVTCSNCGKKIDGDAKFCYFCGSKIINLNICENCGKPISDDANFCNFCGEKIIR